MAIIDLGALARGVQERLGSVFQANRPLAEMLQVLRDTSRVVGNLANTVGRLDKLTRDVEQKLEEVDLSAKRLDRLEEAVLNIERATLQIEAAMSVALKRLPKSVQKRISDALKQE